MGDSSNLLCGANHCGNDKNFFLSCATERAQAEHQRNGYSATEVLVASGFSLSQGGSARTRASSLAQSLRCGETDRLLISPPSFIEMANFR